VNNKPLAPENKTGPCDAQIAIAAGVLVLPALTVPDTDRTQAFLRALEPTQDRKARNVSEVTGIAHQPE
jgi:hypothetical protein